MGEVEASFGWESTLTGSLLPAHQPAEGVYVPASHGSLNCYMAARRRKPARDTPITTSPQSSDTKTLTAGQLRAARALLNWSGEELASRSQVSLATIRRAEREEDTQHEDGEPDDSGPDGNEREGKNPEGKKPIKKPSKKPKLTAANAAALVRALEAGGVEFLAGAGGPGVRLRLDRS